MAEVRPSFRKRTGDLPSGEEPAEAKDRSAPGIEERIEDPAGDEANSSAESGMSVAQDELDDALLAEALDGGPAPPQGETPAAQSGEAVDHTESLNPEAVMEETEFEREVTIYEPPPREVNDLVGGVLPSRPIRAILNVRLEPTTVLDVQEPQQKVDPLELPDRELTEAEKAAILARLGEERIQELEREIEEAYDEIRRRVASNEAVSTEAYNKLLKAQDILLRRDASKLAQAEYYLELVHSRLDRVSASEAAAQKYQWPLFAWGFLWSASFLITLILIGQDWFQRALGASSQSGVLLDTETFVASMLWGGIGGAVAVLYSLFKHVGERDFDSQYVLSYVGKPFLGLVVGGTVYMVFNLVIRALGIFPSGVPDAEGNIVPTVAPGVVYLVAWASGFKEDRILELVDTMMKKIFASLGSGESAQQADSGSTGD
jgi:hypothetical protein